MKKLFAVLLVVAMILSLGVTAFAANEKITVVNAPSGVRYRAYKVFDVTQNADDTLTYTTTAAWKDVLMWTAPVADGAEGYDDYVAQWELANGETYDATKDKTSTQNPLSKTQADKISYIGTATPYEVVTKTGFSSSEFAKFLTPEDADDLEEAPYDAAIECEAVDGKPQERVMKVEDTGYYLVLASKVTPKEYSVIADPPALTAAQYNALSEAEKAYFEPTDDANATYVFIGESTLSEDEYDNSLAELYDEKYVAKESVTTTEYEAFAPFRKALYVPYPRTNPTEYYFTEATQLSAADYAAYTSGFEDEKDAYVVATYVNKNDETDSIPAEVWATLGDAQSNYEVETYTNGTHTITKAQYDDYATLRDPYTEPKEYTLKPGYNQRTKQQVDGLTSDAAQALYEAGAYEFNGPDTLTPDVYNGLDFVKRYYELSDFDFKPIEEKSMMATVLEGKDIEIQNKNDMPLDKEVDTDGDGVYDDNNSGVQVGDELNFKITAKIPELGDDVSSFIYLFTDKMTDGLTQNNKLTIKILKEGEKESGDGDANVEKTIVLEPEDDYKLKYDPEDYATFQFANKTYDPAYELMGNSVRFGKNGYAWELSLDVISTEDSSFKNYAGRFILIEYTATVNADAVCEVIENNAVLAYGTDSDHLEVKDAQTKNYLSKILIDKFEDGTPSKKLDGAEFALYKSEVDTDPFGNTTNTIKYYSLHADQYVNGEGKIIGKTEFDSLNATAQGAYTTEKRDAVIPWAIWKEVDGETVLQATDADGNIKGQFGKDDVKVVWVEITDPTKADDQALITRVRTARDGSAEFGYLADSAKYIFEENAGKEDNPDNAYYLVETKAPVDYTRLLDPIKVEIDGSAATAPNMTPQQRQTILTEVVNVANTPGTSLPSTGGVGATMMTIGGVALILAAGAFLVLRRRKEQE